MYKNKYEQAGAELCQAQVQVDLLAELILQLNFRFGQHWKKVSFLMSSYFQLVPAIEVIFYGGCLLWWLFKCFNVSFPSLSYALRSSSIEVVFH